MRFRRKLRRRRLLCTIAGSIYATLFFNRVIRERVKFQAKLNKQTNVKVFIYGSIMKLYDSLGGCTSLPSQLAHTDAETLFYESLTKRQELITINPKEAHIFYVPFFPLKLEFVNRNSRSCKGSISAHAILEATAQLISDSPWLSHKQHFVVSNYWRTTLMSQNSTFVRLLQQMLFFSYELPPINLKQLGRGVYAPAGHLEVIPYAVPPARRPFIKQKRKFNFFYVGSDTDGLLSFGCKPHTPGIRSCIQNLRRK